MLEEPAIVNRGEDKHLRIIEPRDRIGFSRDLHRRGSELGCMFAGSDSIRIVKYRMNTGDFDVGIGRVHNSCVTGLWTVGT